MTNLSDHEWKSVYLIVNPECENWLDAVWFAAVEERGFRAPADKDQDFGGVKPHGTLTAPLNDFVNTRTGEKFSSARFVVRRVFVHAVLHFQDKELACWCLSKVTKQ